MRRKTRSNVEFGAKISIFVTGDGFTFLDPLSFNSYNEGEDLRAQALAYRRQYGCYPKVICTDQIYRTRSNRASCERHAIRSSGPPLGRPKNDTELVAAEKKKFIDDQRQRNALEKVSKCKRRYRLGLIDEKLIATQGSSIAMKLLIMNLQKLLRLLFIFIALCWQLLIATKNTQRAKRQLFSYQLTCI